MPKKEIKLTIELDDQHVPERIEWEATDAGGGKKRASSMMLYLWDPDAKNSMSIDLWTKDMLLHHMNAHFVHNLLSMADTYQRASSNPALAGMIKNFANQFAAELKKSQEQGPAS